MRTTSRTLQPPKRYISRKITPSRASTRTILAGGKENFRAAGPTDRRTRCEDRSENLVVGDQSEDLGIPPGSYRFLRHMASLDARERVSLNSHGPARARTLARASGDASGLFYALHIRRRRSHPGWLFLRTPGQSRPGKIAFEPAVAPPLCCHRCTSLAGTHHGVWFNH